MTDNILQKLNEAVASQLLTIITKGVDTVVHDPETGKKTLDTVDAPASYFTAALQLLKQNNVQFANTDQDSDVAALQITLANRRLSARQQLAGKTKADLALVMREIMTPDIVDAELVVETPDE